VDQEGCGNVSFNFVVLGSCAEVFCEEEKKKTGRIALNLYQHCYSSQGIPVILDILRIHTVCFLG
jgi:hypothetical protein